MSEDNNYACCPSHCCDQHGCKYNLRGCPVSNHVVAQEGPCQVCGETESGYYGETNQLGYYDRDMAWHPPVGSEDHQHQVEDRILARVAKWLRDRGEHQISDAVLNREFDE